jgi:hypothetical protein
MEKIDISKLSDKEKIELIDNRWNSSEDIFEEVKRIYKNNTDVYSNKASWLSAIPYKRQAWRIQANRIFVNMEAVINSLIANVPGINILPSRKGEVFEEFAISLENYFRKKYLDINVKETFRMGLRNLYFSRLVVLKPFWNPSINDFDLRSIDPRNVRVGKYARKEQETEFVIEEVEDNLHAVVSRFPYKHDELLKKFGINNDTDLYIKNPDVKYKEAWIGNWVVFKLDNIVLDTIPNPYWDWDGILVTDEELEKLEGSDNTDPVTGENRRILLSSIRSEQESRQPKIAEETPEPNIIQKGIQAIKKFSKPENYIEPTQGATSEEISVPDMKPYFFNYFDTPRKPYIFATVFNNENSPIGRTDMITLSSELQKGIDKRKMDIDENAEMANGILKVDSTVMGKADAQRIRFETKGVIWGKGVMNGVGRETGSPLPATVFQDMQDSRNEIDNIMAATSAFRGEREGQETKAGRLALVQQSYQRLNELVHVVDYLAYETFSWFMQLAKTRYTEYHTAKWMGDEEAKKDIEIIQDDFNTGIEVRVIPGKTLPQDDEFKFEQAQNDVAQGYLSPTDYLRIAHYDNPKELTQNAIKAKINPVVASGIPQEEIAELQPKQTEEKPPNVTINYADLSPDAQQQILAKMDINVDPNMLVAEKIADNKNKDREFELKKNSQEHNQMMSEKSLENKNAIPV